MSKNEKPNDRHDYELVGEHVRIYQRGQTWYANYQHEGRQHRQSLHTRNKKEARRRAIRLEAKLLEGQMPSAAGAQGLERVIAKYKQFLENEGRAKKTLQKYTNVFDRLQALAKRRRVTKVSGITLEVIDAYKAQRTDDKAAKKTIHTEVVVIRQLVNFALSRKMIAADPLGKLKLKKPKLRAQPCWSRKEVEAILAAAKEPQRAMLTLLAETGMRVGELKHLTWEDVDAEHGVILIREKEGWKPKTGDRRSIPISPMAKAVLAVLPRRAPWVVTAAPSKRYPKGDHKISERRLLEYLKRVLKRLGLKGHLHTFRHSFISHALVQGIPEAIVRKWVGHVDPEVMKLYTHVLDEASQEAMKRLTEGGPKKGEKGGEKAKDKTKDRPKGSGQEEAAG